MATHHLDVLFEECFALGPFLTGGGHRDSAGLQKSGERHLGINGDVLAAGQVDDHVGAAGTGIRGDLRLHIEVDALQ